MTDDIILYLQSYFQKCHLYQSSSSKSIGGPSLLLKIKHSLWKWVFLFFSVGVQSFLWSGSKVMFLTALSHTPCHVLLSLPAGLLPHCFIFLFRAAITAGNCIIRVIDASWLFPNCWFFFFMFLFSEYCYEGYKESASPVVPNFGQSLEYGIMREGKVGLIWSRYNMHTRDATNHRCVPCDSYFGCTKHPHVTSTQIKKQKLPAPQKSWVEEAF